MLIQMNAAKIIFLNVAKLYIFLALFVDIISCNLTVTVAI